ncbi:hypothetical protein AXF42_Ash009326 [Apostasia shenzhenica]|uniref:Uncharacterized protein n=1 Tax=Apostasia shenzhenica TaxID=1088818 RepID=A0A2I0B3S1_9ASPA|nr:hypothetical protein AXF42_Ash009326 [Apostasia shenzhenica]
MRQSSGDDEHMEYLMAVSGEVVLPRPPPLWHPADVEPRPHQVEPCHGRLPRQHLLPPLLGPVRHRYVQGRYGPGETHSGEEHGPEATVGRADGGEEGNHGGDGEGEDGGEIEEAPPGGEEEGVGDRGEERGCDHGGDAGVVEAAEEEVEAAGVAAEEVAEGRGQEADRCAGEEDHERPPGCGFAGLGGLVAVDERWRHLKVKVVGII